MEGLAPPLKCLLEVRWCIENGLSVRNSLHQYLQSHTDDFDSIVHQWLFKTEQGVDTKALILSIKSPYRRTLLNIFAFGLQGGPILSKLNDLESELIIAGQREVDLIMNRLPFLTMIPLFFLQFPAFLMLLFGPLLTELLENLN